MKEGFAEGKLDKLLTGASRASLTLLNPLLRHCRTLALQVCLLFE
jgi:hypothetical protein